VWIKEESADHGKDNYDLSHMCHCFVDFTAKQLILPGVTDEKSLTKTETSNIKTFWLHFMNVINVVTTVILTK